MPSRPDEEALIDYFERHVRPDLRPLDEARSASAWTRASGLVLALLALLAIGLVFVFNAAPDDARIAAAFFTAISLALVALLFTLFYGARLLLALFSLGGPRAFERRFKQQVIEALLLELDPRLEYTTEEHVGMDAFVESGLFTDPPDRLVGNDRTRGRRGDAVFEFSEVEAQKETPGFWGGRYEQFHGVLLVVDGAPPADGHTVVLPDRYERYVGAVIGDRLNPRQQSDLGAVRLQDADFERQFMVFATEQAHAEQALTARNRDALLELEERIGTARVRAAFRGPRVYVTLATGPIFEASIFRPIGEADVRGVHRIADALLTFVERVGTRG